MRMVLFNIAVVAGVIWMGTAPANAAPPSLSGIGNTGMFVARGERVASLPLCPLFQTSTCSEIAKASSTAMPRYLDGASILVWSSRT
jgi:hypothetical protein